MTRIKPITATEIPCAALPELRNLLTSAGEQRQQGYNPDSYPNEKVFFVGKVIAGFAGGADAFHLLFSVASMPSANYGPSKPC